MKRTSDGYINSLLKGRRPKPFPPTQENLVAARTAIDLLADSPDAHAPGPGFVEALYQRIAAQEADEPSATATTADGIATVGTATTADAAAGPPRPTKSPRTAARRRFLQAGVLTATGAASGIVADQLLAGAQNRPSAATAQPTPNELLPTKGTWQTVAASADLPEGTVTTFDLGSINGVVRRVSGRVQAMSATCTHQACRLDLNALRNTLVCPCHGATFSLSGNNLTHPNAENQHLPALPRLAVREYQGNIQVYAPGIAS